MGKWNLPRVTKSVGTDIAIRIRRKEHSKSFIIILCMFKMLEDMKDKNDQTWISGCEISDMENFLCRIIDRLNVEEEKISNLEDI